MVLNALKKEDFTSCKTLFAIAMKEPHTNPGPDLTHKKFMMGSHLCLGLCRDPLSVCCGAGAGTLAGDSCWESHKKASIFLVEGASNISK
eukprot:scaffold87948_cov66-Attheya_sp.AAC.1